MIRGGTMIAVEVTLRSGHGRSHESSLLVEVSAHLVLAQK